MWGSVVFANHKYFFWGGLLVIMLCSVTLADWKKSEILNFPLAKRG
jgi:hypothetical protein